MTALMQACVENTILQKYIRFYGFKLHSYYPKLLDYCDAEHELWEAVFRAIQNRFSRERPLVQFAKRAVLSRYGTMIKSKGNRTRFMSEQTSCHAEIPVFIDESFEKVEAIFTLDQIERDLEKCMNQSRQYHLAVQTFRHLRKGVKLKNCHPLLDISPSHVYHIHEIIRTFSKKYSEKVHYY